MKLMIALVAVMVLNVSAIYAENNEPENYLRRSTVKSASTPVAPVAAPVAVADNSNPAETRNATNATWFRCRRPIFWGPQCGGYWNNGCNVGWNNCGWNNCGWNNGCNVGWGGGSSFYSSRTVFVQQTPVFYPQPVFAGSNFVGGSSSTFYAGNQGGIVDPGLIGGINPGIGGAFAPGPFAGPGNLNGGFNVPGLRQW